MNFISLGIIALECGILWFWHVECVIKRDAIKKNYMGHVGEKL